MFLLFVGRALAAQATTDSTIVVSLGFDTSAYVSAEALIELTLSRAPSASEGRIAVFVGTADLTSLFDAVGTKLVYRANGVDLPSGESEIKVFLVSGAVWKELSKVAIRVLTHRGFKKAELDPGLEMRNTGQLDEGHSGTQPAPDRRRYQSVAGTMGLETTHLRDGFSLTSSTHLLGAGETNERLRFGERGSRASPVDLADYVLRYEGQGAVLSVGQVSAGFNRHLINTFASRGVTAVFGGPRATWSVGAENGTSIVGTDNIIGLDRGDHRIVSSSFALEMMPSRPGALHIDATALRGSLLPTSGFTSGGVTAADRSDGYGVQLAASTPSQRVRFGAGLASSRSQFAADPPLLIGGSLVPTRPHRKGARYAEANVGLLRDDKLFHAIPVTLNLALRHERVDPLYRSVATSVQSDLARDGFDLGGNVDLVTVQFAQGRTVDNIDAIESLLTNRTRTSSLSLQTLLASLLRITRGALFLPTVSYASEHLHQFAPGIPAGGSFTASDIPDLLSFVQDASAQWHVRQWQLAYRMHRSDQDNRQVGRELADVATRTHGVNVGVTAGPDLTLALDLGLERQQYKEFSQVNHVRRAGLTGNWRVTPVTTFDGSVTLSKTEDTGVGSNTHDSAIQAGVARGVNFWRSTEETPRGQFFVRYTRHTNALFDLAVPSGPPTQSAGMWNIGSGLTLRLF